MSLRWLSQIRAVLFDWGGTLCKPERTRETTRRGIDAVVRLLGVPESQRSALAGSLAKAIERAHAKADANFPYREVNLAEVLRGWAEQIGIDMPGWDPQRAATVFWDEWYGCLCLQTDAAYVLGELKRRGYRLGLLSNVAAPADVCERELARLGVRDFFEVRVFSSAVGVRKPNPEIFGFALRQFSASQQIAAQQVVYVGDSPLKDIYGAQQAGLRAILMRDPAVPIAEAEQCPAEPDAIVDRLYELLVLLRGPAG